MPRGVKMSIYNTKRLSFRPISMDDAFYMDVLLDDIDIASNNYNVPYPYTVGFSKGWIEKGIKQSNENELMRWVIQRTDHMQVVGIIELRINNEHDRAELGYWIGKDFRGNGYCKEAVEKILDISFNEYKLNRLEAFCFTDNKISIRILEEIGFKIEGMFRQDSKILNEYKNSLIFGLLRDEYAIS